MLGALIGDIADSRFRLRKQKYTKKSELLSAISGCRTTDVSDITLAAANSILQAGGNLSTFRTQLSQNLSKFEPLISALGEIREDNNSTATINRNALLSAGACGLAASSIEEAIDYADVVSETAVLINKSHKPVESISAAIFLAKSGESMLSIRDYVETNYYSINFTLDNLYAFYDINSVITESVPFAFEAFFESTDFESAIRNAISIESSDETVVSITGSLAEAYYGIPNDLRKHALF